MISGDPYLRAYNSSIDDSRSITIRCLSVRVLLLLPNNVSDT